MNNIIEYIDTNFYKNSEINNLKLINKYINNLNELKKKNIKKNRAKIAYKYDIYDIFKYIDTNFFEDNDIKTIQKTTKAINKSINIDKINKNRYNFIINFYQNSIPANLKIKFYNKELDREKNEGLWSLPSIYKIIDKLNAKKSMITEVISPIYKLEINCAFFGEIRCINTKEKWKIKKKWLWSDNMLKILKDKYKNNKLYKEFYIVECNIWLIKNPDDINKFTINPYKSFSEQLDWNITKYLTLNDDWGISNEILIECIITTKKNRYLNNVKNINFENNK